MPRKISFDILRFRKNGGTIDKIIKIPVDTGKVTILEDTKSILRNLFGSVKSYAQIILLALAYMKSASNGGLLKGRLQVLHIHVFLVTPLGAGYMPQPGTDQHESGVALWEGSHHSSVAADLLVQPLEKIVGKVAIC